MRIVRSPRQKAYDFAGPLVGPIQTHALAVGLTAPQAQAYADAVSDLGDAIDDLNAAKAAYKAAVSKANDKYRVMNHMVTATVERIDLFAATQANPQAVYDLCQVPPPSVPGEAPPPAKPTGLTVSLDAANGWINLAWKAANPVGSAGTAYIVRRRLPGETTFSFIGVTGVKKFSDTTFFAGPDSVQYTVQGQRSDRSGQVSEVFTVNFGQSGGDLTAFVAGGGENKLAA